MFACIILGYSITKIAYFFTLCVRLCVLFLGFFKGFRLHVDTMKGGKRIKNPRCFAQPAFSPPTPVIELFCNEPVIGNRMRFILVTRGAQLVLCDVHVYGSKFSINNQTFFLMP